ncbi:TetR/AcrR family transcriptional regulator [Thermophagus sp. OGC60D27]|uniref:TetR/AcrR family transcriptional regulator n=1 Tax=Thermophagus sp. OGC60D27 TaxID=3458415 RepID=UPI0040382620
MDVRERIMREAGSLFFARGIKRVTMDDLASAVGVSKRTIYENFNDKVDLLKAAIGFFQSQHDQNMKGMIEKSDSVIEIIIGMLHYGYESFKVVNPVYLEDLKKFYPEIWDDSIRKSRESSHDKLQHLLERGQKEGLFRIDVNSRLVAKIFYEQIFLLHNNEVFPVDEFPRKELYESVFFNFTRGICTGKGIALLEQLWNNPDARNIGLG